MQSVGVKEFRVGVTTNWETKLVYRRLSFFDFYILSMYLKEYLEKIFVLEEFVDLGYLYSHSYVKFYLTGFRVEICFYDGFFEEFLEFGGLWPRRRRRGRGRYREKLLKQTSSMVLLRQALITKLSLSNVNRVSNEKVDLKTDILLTESSDQLMKCFNKIKEKI